MQRGVLVWLIAAVAIAGVTQAATVCKQKSGVLLLRTSACKKKETAVQLADLGVTGPKGDAGAKGDAGVAGNPGAAGAPGGMRAWAHVAANTTTLLSALNVTGVTHPATGVYCLTPEAGVDANQGPALVSPDAGQSTSMSLVTWVEFPVFNCSPGRFEVRTQDLTGAASNAVGFVFAVP